MADLKDCEGKIPLEFADENVERVFKEFPPKERQALLALRARIFKIAAARSEIGSIEETLKWGQPAYLTSQTRSGSTIRLGLPKTGGYALYTHCGTSLIADFRSQFEDSFHFEGNRAVHFSADEWPDFSKIDLLIERALTYHLKS